MIRTFECKVCHKIKLCHSKEEYKEEYSKHWKETKMGRQHTPMTETTRIEMRTSSNGKPYMVYVAE